MDATGISEDVRRAGDKQIVHLVSARDAIWEDLSGNKSQHIFCRGRRSTMGPMVGSLYKAQSCSLVHRSDKQLEA